MRVAVGCDHGGLALKDVLCGVLKSAGVEVLDMGTGNEDSVDYPDFAAKVARSVTSGDADRGLAICGTGIGMSIALNKYPGVRAALCHDSFTARLSRQHNDANILVLGGRVLGQEVAADMVKQWLATPFEGGRHQKRLDKITQIERDICKG
ncbi:MAG TPA: ribose 5-phosphate isomerase B [Nitrospirota bacterium]|jgi:ribose 5-phosphate isomerase B